jgi:hypothetical protein
MSSCAGKYFLLLVWYMKIVKNPLTDGVFISLN